MPEPESAHTVSIDFSKATKLTNVVLRPKDRSIAWVIMALRTLTSKHGDLREVAIHINFYTILAAFDNPVDARRIVGDQIYALWMELDHLLVQLSESGVVHVRVRCLLSGKKKECVKGLLPEMEKGGSTRLLDYSDL